MRIYNKKALKGYAASIIIAILPFLLALAGVGGEDFQRAGWAFMFFTIPAGILIFVITLILHTYRFFKYKKTSKKQSSQPFNK